MTAWPEAKIGRRGGGGRVLVEHAVHGAVGQVDDDEPGATGVAEVSVVAVEAHVVHEAVLVDDGVEVEDVGDRAGGDVEADELGGVSDRVLLADAVAHVHGPEGAVGAETHGVDVDELVGGVVPGGVLAEGGVGERHERAVDVFGNLRQRVLAVLALDDHEDALGVGREGDAVGDGVVRHRDDGRERGLGRGGGGIDNLGMGGGGDGGQRSEDKRAEEGWAAEFSSGRGG